MFKKKGWLSVGVVGAFFLAVVPCAVLSLQALCKRENRDAGILTVQFVDLPEIKLIDPRSVLTGDGIKGLGSKIPGASAAVTRASSITGQVQGVASSVLGAVETPINDVIPKNFSLGTKRYCVGYSNRNDCENLPVKLSKFWPKSIASRKTRQPSRKKPSESFEKYVARITSTTIRGSLIIGLSAVPILATLLVFSLWKPTASFRPRCVPPPLSILHVLVAVIVFVSFLIPTGILYTLLSKAHQLPFKVESGKVSGYCLGSLCSAVVMIVCAIVLPIILGCN